MESDRVSAKKSTKNKHFTSIKFTNDDKYLIGGGNSKNLCIYDLQHQVLIKKVVLTKNYSFDGIKQKLNQKKKEEQESDDDLKQAKTFDVSKR